MKRQMLVESHNTAESQLAEWKNMTRITISLMGSWETGLYIEQVYHFNKPNQGHWNGWSGTRKIAEWEPDFSQAVCTVSEVMNVCVTLPLIAKVPTFLSDSPCLWLVPSLSLPLSRTTIPTGFRSIYSHQKASHQSLIKVRLRKWVCTPALKVDLWPGPTWSFRYLTMNTTSSQTSPNYILCG